MQEEGIDLKNCLFVCSWWSWREYSIVANGHFPGELGLAD